LLGFYRATAELDSVSFLKKRRHVFFPPPPLERADFPQHWSENPTSPPSLLPSPPDTRVEDISFVSLWFRLCLSSGPFFGGFAILLRFELLTSLFSFPLAFFTSTCDLVFRWAILLQVETSWAPTDFFCWPSSGRIPTVGTEPQSLMMSISCSTTGQSFGLYVVLSFPMVYFPRAVPDFKNWLFWLFGILVVTFFQACSLCYLDLLL